MTPHASPIRLLIWVSIFGAAFAFVESSVVVYLRAIYYPDGFTFPLKATVPQHIVVELIREVATIIMLVAVGIIAGRRGWRAFGYFLVAFGFWDVFYYVWLKATLDWPAAPGEWDILFLIPVPWIAPVIAPVAIAGMMIVFGWMMVVRLARDGHFQVRWLSWVLGILGTALVLYSFMVDTDATLRSQPPQPYRYELLVLAIVAYCAGFALAYRQPPRRRLSRA